MLTQAELENKYIEDATQTIGSCSALMLIYKQQRDEAIAANQKKDTRIAELEALVEKLRLENEQLKRSQLNYIYENGAIHEDKKTTIQVLNNQLQEHMAIEQ